MVHSDCDLYFYIITHIHIILAPPPLLMRRRVSFPGSRLWPRLCNADAAAASSLRLFCLHITEAEDVIKSLLRFPPQSFVFSFLFFLLLFESF